MQKRQFIVITFFLSIGLWIGQFPMIHQNFMYSEDIMYLLWSDTSYKSPLLLSLLDNLFGRTALLAMVLLPIVSVVGCFLEKEHVKVATVVCGICLIFGAFILADSLTSFLATANRAHVVTPQYPSYTTVSYQTDLIHFIGAGLIVFLNTLGLKAQTAVHA